MAMSNTELSDAAKTNVAATVPILKEHGVAITRRMYERLFENHPSVVSLFDNAPDDQAERLANAVLAYAENIDNVAVLLPVVNSIAEKHVGAGVDPALYETVGGELLGAMVDVLGELPSEVVSAWAEAYGYLADLFIEIETELSSAA